MASDKPHVLARPGVLITLGSALLVIVLIGLMFRSDEEPEEEAAPEPPADPTPTPTMEPPVLEGPVPPEVDPALMLGAEDAAVTMVIFGDYQCPNCAIFATDHQPRLIEDYVEPGDLRLVWRDYPYMGEESEEAAVAARAAARQDAFWEYQDALYTNPDAWRGGTESFLDIAAELDLDTDQFATDLDDPDLRDAVDADHEFAVDLTVPGTPAFLINGETFFGAQPLSEFTDRIEAARDQNT